MGRWEVGLFVEIINCFIPLFARIVYLRAVDCLFCLFARARGSSGSVIFYLPQWRAIVLKWIYNGFSLNDFESFKNFQVKLSTFNIISKSRGKVGALLMFAKKGQCL